MADIRINGTPALGVKALAPTYAASALQALLGKKDGYDTLGVTTAAGDYLVLLESSKALNTSTPVTVDGLPAKVNFTENEKNTFAERFKAPFKSTAGKVFVGVGATFAMAIAVLSGDALGFAGVGLVVGTILWGAFGSVVVGAALGALGTMNATVGSFFKPTEHLTDGLAK